MTDVYSLRLEINHSVYVASLKNPCREKGEREHSSEETMTINQSTQILLLKSRQTTLVSFFLAPEFRTASLLHSDPSIREGF